MPSIPTPSSPPHRLQQATLEPPLPFRQPSPELPPPESHQQPESW
ncbi:hypothetical protein [Rhodothermus marinus]|nr:hypothetical protein [Rhodothermus marinus]